MTVAERIRARMAHNHTTQAQLRAGLAEAGDPVSRSAVSAWVRTDSPSRPSLARMHLIMDVLTVPSQERPAWLAQWMAEEAPAPVGGDL